MSFDYGAWMLCVIDSSLVCVSSTVSYTKVFDLVKLRSIDVSIVFVALITGLVIFIAVPFVSSMVSFAARASSVFVENLLIAVCDDDFNGFLLNICGSPLICILFAAPNRHKNDLRGNVFDCNVPSLAGAVGRAKPLGFGIRVSTDDVDEPLSKRGIFVCFNS